MSIEHPPKTGLLPPHGWGDGLGSEAYTVISDVELPDLIWLK